MSRSCTSTRRWATHRRREGSTSSRTPDRPCRAHPIRVGNDVALIRLLFACVVIGAVAFATFQWRSPGSVATAAPIQYAAEAPTGQFPAAALDAREHGRGPVVPTGALTGFAVPVGFELPDDPDLLPGAAREYRAGFHEGVDFPLAFGMPVAAAKAGRIVRIDTDYVRMERGRAAPGGGRRVPPRVHAGRDARQGA